MQRGSLFRPHRPQHEGIDCEPPLRHFPDRVFFIQVNLDRS